MVVLAGSAAADSGPDVGDLEVAIEPDRCRAGEVVTASVSGGMRDVMYIVWNAEKGDLASPWAQETTFTCPDVACPDEGHGSGERQR